MSRDFTVLLGCVQSEAWHSNPSGQPQVYETCLAERVTLPRPPAGAHHIAVDCKHCQQTVRIQVRSRRLARSKRLSARLALAASVCLWAAATALALLYVLDPSPSAPGREVLVAGILGVAGAVLWVSVDRQAAFASEVVAGCTIEHAPVEKAWARRVSPKLRKSLPRHVLLDPEQELAAGLGAELVRAVRAALGRPGVAPTTTTSARSEGYTDLRCPPAVPSSSQAPPPSSQESTLPPSRNTAAAA